MARLFMELLDDPFAALESELPPAEPKKSGYDAVFVDVHGEATSEKMAIGHVSDGRASLVVGTHTHVPTADTVILTGGTGYQTDAGMCGDYDSVIGMQKQGSIHNFLRRMPRERMMPAEGEATLCGVFVETDSQTGLASMISPVRRGGRLARRCHRLLTFNRQPGAYFSAFSGSGFLGGATFSTTLERPKTICRPIAPPSPWTSFPITARNAST